jgi:hypothetical protein
MYSYTNFFCTSGHVTETSCYLLFKLCFSHLISAVNTICLKSIPSVYSFSNLKNLQPPPKKKLSQEPIKLYFTHTR